MSCKCYHDDLNFLGKRGVCWGTKECEACSCEWDESKCDFYQYVRDRARPKTTNADKYFRNATDEELAAWLEENATGCPPDSCCDTKANLSPKVCVRCWLEWLKQETQE